MPLFSGLFRLVQEAVPLAAAIAPLALPGLGGVFAGAGINLLASGMQNPVQQAGFQQAMVRAQCPPLGVPGGGFSSPFQSTFFQSGGSLAGRGMQASFVGGTAIGRPRGVCPAACPCPPKDGLTRFAQPITPPPKGNFLTRRISGLLGGQAAAAAAPTGFAGALQQQLAAPALTSVGAPLVAGVAPTPVRIPRFGGFSGFGGF